MRNKIFLTWIATLTAAIMGVLAVTILPSAMIPAQGVPEMGEVKWDVIIDAGHGGFDGGAVADDGTLEKDVNLAISQKLSEILRCMGVRVLMTRETDEGLENPEDRTIRQKKLSDMRRRLAIMEESGAGVFVSIHLNKYSSEGP